MSCVLNYWALGGEAGCRRLSADFYRRVSQDQVLRPLFSGKSLRCAVEEFSAFLVQFLDAGEAATQRRWWLSLRESHARFNIGPTERGAWLRMMGATLEAVPVAEATAIALAAEFVARPRCIWHGFVEIAQALLDCGAALDAIDRKGVTPLQRAIQCRQHAVAELLTRYY